MFPSLLWASWRRAMRRHQHVPDRVRRLPMWRLIGGELLWAAVQLWRRPSVLVALIGGWVATFAVVSAAAPGPVLNLPLAIVVAIIAGLSLAAGVRQLQDAGTPGDRRAVHGRGDDSRPLLGAVVLSAAVTVATLATWLAFWLVSWLT